MKQVAYYKGCLASLSAKELDTSTRALAPKVGYELLELDSVTCCGAGDIHEAEPDYYLHLNARILAYAAATGSDTLMTVCNVCTLNLRQANHQLLNDPALRERVNDNLERVGAPRYARAAKLLDDAMRLAAAKGITVGECVTERIGQARAACEAARLLAYRVIDQRTQDLPPTVTSIAGLK